jgi:hypothetical protein
MTVDSDELYRGLVEHLVENPEDVAGKLGTSVDVVEEVGPQGFNPRYTPSLEGSPVEYVIITSDEFASYFQELANWKTKKGVPAVVRTVSWIEANYPGGCDTAERIRMFLKDAYESWGTTYVLLGGDTDVVPPRYASTAYYGGESVPGDVYYSSLEGNWNADGDAVFGEAYVDEVTRGDSVDFYPDVYVGRAPVNNIVEVDTFLDKCEAYEKTPSLWYTTRNLYLAEMLFPYDWQSGPFSMDGAADIAEPMQVYIPTSVHGVKMYYNHAQFPNTYPLNAPAARDSIDRGYNIVVHVGHANKDIMRVGLNNYISMTDASAFSNTIHRASAMWLLNCTSAAIDYDCIAERLMNDPEGGAWSVVGPTRFAFPATLREYLWDWLDILYNWDPVGAGVVCALSRAEHASPGESGLDNTNRWTQLAMVYLGEPEAKIWTSRPKLLTVVHPNSVRVGATGMTVTVTDPAPVFDAVVCVSKGGEVYARGTTGSSGQVTLSFTPHTTGTLSVTVTATNHIPRETTASVIAATGSYVYLQSWTVDDDALGASIGNANGKAESGETIELDLTVRNGGVSSASGVAATLSTSDACVSIQDGTESLGTIAAGATRAANEAFRVLVNGTCQNDHDVSFTVQFTATGGLSWSQSAKLRVYRPHLRPAYVDVDDSLGNGNGVPEVGETVTVLFQVLNDGNGDAKSLSGKLRYHPPGVAIADSTDTWGDVSAGSSKTGSGGFRFTVQNPFSHHFRLILKDTYGNTWPSYVGFVPPAAPDSLSGRVKGTTIDLSWPPTADNDLLGYDVYRATNISGPYQRANDATIGQIAHFADSGLEENTLFHYYVAAIDSSGNASAPSPILSISTNPPSQLGWPLSTMGGMYASPAVADIDGDGDLEVVVSSDQIYAWHDDGREVWDGDGDPRTNGVYAIDGQGGYRSSVAIGEVDGDPGLEIVAAAWRNVGTTESPAYEVFVWNAEDGSVLPGWPTVTKGFCWASPALGDLDHDGRAEVIIPSSDGYLYCWRYNGSELIDGDQNPLTTGVFAWLGAPWAYGSPAVVDLDGDHDLEIIQPGADGYIYAFEADGSDVTGWPFYVEAKSVCSPSVGDVDLDGKMEVAVGSNASKMWLLRHDGTVMPGWPIAMTLGGDFPPSPVLANVLGDARLEVVLAASSGGWVAVKNYLGQTQPGWPQYLGGNTKSSPAVADVDGDPQMEIIIGCDDGKLYGFDGNGARLAGWPIQTDAEVVGSPAVLDLDGDGDNEVIVGGMDANVYVWDCAGLYLDGDGVEWGCFLHDMWRSQFYGFEVPVGIDGGDDAWSDLAGVVLKQNAPNPFNPVTTIVFGVPGAGGDPIPVTLCIYGARGELVRTLVDGPMVPGRHAAVWDGRDGAGRSVASGVYFMRLSGGGTSAVGKMVLLK